MSALDEVIGEYPQLTSVLHNTVSFVSWFPRIAELSVASSSSAYTQREWSTRIIIFFLNSTIREESQNWKFGMVGATSEALFLWSSLPSILHIDIDSSNLAVEMNTKPNMRTYSFRESDKSSLRAESEGTERILTTCRTEYEAGAQRGFGGLPQRIVSESHQLHVCEKAI